MFSERGRVRAGGVSTHVVTAEQRRGGGIWRLDAKLHKECNNRPLAAGCTATRHSEANLSLILTSRLLLRGLRFASDNANALFYYLSNRIKVKFRA